MDLKEFIAVTLTSIAEASAESRDELEPLGVIINPPIAAGGNHDSYHPTSQRFDYQRVQNIDFDVAVTASSETSAGGKGGLKVLSFEAGAEGKHSRQSEQVSRVRFSIPMILPPSLAERPRSPRGYTNTDRDSLNDE